jgi:glycosyltransferase involved in cell wall biosynthesis
LGDCYRLDVAEVPGPGAAPPRLYSNVPWDEADSGAVPPVRPVLAGRWLARLAAPLSWRLTRPLAALLAAGAALVQAVALLWASRRRDAVVLLNFGDRRTSLLFCLLKSVFWRKCGRVLAYDIFYTPGLWRRRLYRRALGATTCCVVWSRRQVEVYSRELGLPRDQFVFLPYKANHSKSDEPALPVGDYVFSGGNSARDYRTLFAAVDGLDVPVVVSTTDPAVTRGLAVPKNVVLVRATEPYFRRLMAGSRLVAVCIRKGVVRTAGEASFLNAMWHGKPVVVADDLAAGDYVDHGREGFVVPAGDAEGVRRGILAAWGDAGLCRSMGAAARRKVEACFTHRLWCRRLLRLAAVLAAG